MSSARRWAVAGVLGLLLLHLAWHGLPWPVAGARRWSVLGLSILPLAPTLVLLLLRKPSAIFWAGVAALLYFCHGVTEAWTIASSRPLALAEIALSLLTIVAGSWDGMKARFGRRGAASPNV